MSVHNFHNQCTIPRQWLCNTSTICVQMHTICVQYLYNMYVMCMKYFNAQCVYNTFAINVLSLGNDCRIPLLYVHKCLQCVRNASTMCAQYPYMKYVMCLKYLYNVCTILSQYTCHKRQPICNT